MNDELFVRPPGVPVPPAFAGTALGEVFARMPRFVDGPRHDALRRHAVALIDGWSDDAIERRAREAARTCAERVTLPADLNTFVEEVAPTAIALLLGIAAEAGVVRLARDFARAIGPSADDGDIARGIAAAKELVQLVPGETDDARAVAAGFFFQSFDATAGAIGNALAATLGEPRDYSEGPVRNTRRFTREGELVIVDLASHPFGHGAHACPGRAVATCIASAAVDALAETGFDLSRVRVIGYKPYPNVKIPIFG